MAAKAHLKSSPYTTECTGEQTDDDTSTEQQTSVLCTFATTYRSFDYEYDDETGSSDDEPLASLCGPVDVLCYSGSSETEGTGEGDAENNSESNNDEGGLTMPRNRTRISHYFSETAREKMKKLEEVQNRQKTLALLNPTFNFLRCPRGHPSSHNYFKRQNPGPFTNCPMPNHVYGDEFYKLPFRTKPAPKFESWRRPPEIKEKKKRINKICRKCEGMNFTHHKDTSQYHWDYLSQVTFKSNDPSHKIWPHHLADLQNCSEYENPDLSDKVVQTINPYLSVPTVIESIEITYKPATKKRSVAIKLGKKSLSKAKNTHNNLKTASYISKEKFDKEKSNDSLYELIKRSLASKQSPESLTCGSNPSTNNSFNSPAPSKKKIGGKKLLKKPASAIPIPVRRVKSYTSVSTAAPSVKRKSSNATSTKSNRVPTATHNKKVPQTSRCIKSQKRNSTASVAKPKIGLSERFSARNTKNVKIAQNSREDTNASVITNSQSSSITTTTTARNQKKIHISQNQKVGNKKIQSKKLVRRKSKGKKKQEQIIKEETDTSFEDELAEFKTEDGELDEEKYRKSVLQTLMSFRKIQDESTKKKKRESQGDKTKDSAREKEKGLASSRSKTETPSWKKPWTAAPKKSVVKPASSRPSGRQEKKTSSMSARSPFF